MPQVKTGAFFRTRGGGGILHVPWLLIFGNANIKYLNPKSNKNYKKNPKKLLNAC
jgi:hypothetical protein